MVRLNEAYMLSFIMDTDKQDSVVTVVKAHPDGKLEAVQRVTGDAAEAVYSILFPEKK